MAESHNDRSPSDIWRTDSEGSGDDDMDFQLAEESTPSGETDDMDSDGLGQEAGGEQTTLYYDAEEGLLRTEDGDAVTFDVVSEDEHEEDDSEQNAEAFGQTGHDESGDGARTPQPEPTAAATGTQPGTHTVRITQEQILELLNHAGIRAIFQQAGATTRSAGRRRHVQLTDDGDEEDVMEDDEEDEDDDDDDDEDDEEETYNRGYGARRRRRPRPFIGDRYPPIPSPEGKELMESGRFGSNDRCDHSACGVPLSQSTLGKRKRLARRVFDREMGIGNRGRTAALTSLATQSLLPSSKADLIVNLNARCYSGQFSQDGSFFFACGQDFKVRMYDTSNPYDWKYYKTVNYYGGQWTITDATLSPDNKNLAYCSIRSQVCLAQTAQDNESEATLLDFSDMGAGGHGGRGGHGWGRSNGHFGIWSIRFSGDGKEIVAGTSDASVYVYDLEARRSILRIPAHGDDVNAVCFGDQMSPHILYSGSDDTTIKVWDRRSLSSMRPAGMFLGHTEGLTYIDSKGDGRYVISNAKDQTCKLWDLRKMINTDAAERINPQDHTTNFDYRFSPYDVSDHTPHPHDCSVVTFRGHKVLKTLIRCHFSPEGSTNGRYIYSGSHDGKVYIWNLDGTLAGEPINVLSATKNSRPASDERFVDRYDYYGRGGTWKTIVRDCSWHPSAPIIAATSWNGWDHGLGTCSVHSWNDGVEMDEVAKSKDEDHGGLAKTEEYLNASSLGSAPMGARVNAQLHHEERFYTASNDTGRRSQGPNRRAGLLNRMGLGAFVS
nr:lec14b protein [Quercus suber]